MDQISEFKVKASATLLSVAYIMNRQAAIDGRTADIDSLLATITEAVRSIYRDRVNETFTDSMRANRECEISQHSAPANYQQSVACALRNLDKPEDAPAATRQTPCETEQAASSSSSSSSTSSTSTSSSSSTSTTEEGEEEGEAESEEEPPPNACNTTATRSAIPRCQTPCKTQPQQAHGNRTQESARKADAARQAEAATQAAAAEVTITAAASIVSLSVVASSSRLPKPIPGGALKQRSPGLSRQARAVAQGSKLPMRNQTIAGCPTNARATAPSGATRARSTVGMCKTSKPVAGFKKPTCPISRPQSTTATNRNRPCTTKATAKNCKTARPATKRC